MENFFEALINILKQPSAIITLVVLALSIYGKSILKIFNLGINFNKRLVTRDEQTSFEDKIRKDLNDTKIETQRTTLDVCMRSIEKEDDKIEDLKQENKELKIELSVINEKLENLLNQTKKMEQVAELLKEHDTRLNRLDYGTDKGSERRSE